MKYDSVVYSLTLAAYAALFAGEAGFVSALVRGAGCAVLAFPACCAWTPTDNCHTATASDKANKLMVTKRRDDLTFMAHSQGKDSAGVRRILQCGQRVKRGRKATSWHSTLYALSLTGMCQ